MSKTILGITPVMRSDFDWWGGHDAGACLLRDGKIVAIGEEERFSRQKHASKPSFPENSIEFVLRKAGIDISDVDYIAVGRDPKRAYNRLQDKGYRSLVPSSISETWYSLSQLARIAAAYRGRPVSEVRNKIDSTFDETFTGEIRLVPHHLSHATSAAYCSDAVDPITITIDASGENDGTVLWDSDLNRVREFSQMNSIGRFYNTGCLYLGYRWTGDAGKVMGLAPYGEQRDDYDQLFEEITSIGEGTYDVSDVIDGGVSFLEERFGPRRVYPEDFTQAHKDFAYHLQKRTEEIVTELVEWHLSEQGGCDLALAGGVALNCKLNRTLLDLPTVDSIFIQPASGDSGLCLGAALEVHRQVTGSPPDPEFTHVYFGPEYTNDGVEEVLQNAKMTYTRPDDIIQDVATLLADGNLVGWFQGRMEYGPRALGNRSILADPRTQESLDLVNTAVKDREPWRPFAPSLLYEAREEYLEYGDESSYMILTDTVVEGKREEIPAVVHVDDTTRPQTLREETNERYYRLIEAFADQTGVPVVLNTSFNISGQPIVESPKQALSTFSMTGLDALAIEDYLLTKPGVTGPE